MSDYPASEVFSAGKCGNGSYQLNMPNQGDITYSEPMTQALKAYLTDMPSTKEAKVDPIMRGFIYTSWVTAGDPNGVNTSSNTSTIQFFTHLSKYWCPKGWTSSANFGGAYQTRCVLPLQ